MKCCWSWKWLLGHRERGFDLRSSYHGRIAVDRRRFESFCGRRCAPSIGLTPPNLHQTRPHKQAPCGIVWGLLGLDGRRRPAAVSSGRLPIVAYRPAHSSRQASSRRRRKVQTSPPTHAKWRRTRSKQVRPGIDWGRAYRANYASSSTQPDHTPPTPPDPTPRHITHPSPHTHIYRVRQAGGEAARGRAERRGRPRGGGL